MAGLWSGVTPKSLTAGMIPQVDREIVLQKLSPEEKEVSTFVPKLLEILISTRPPGQLIKTEIGDFLPDALSVKLMDHCKNQTLFEYLLILYARMTKKLDEGFGLPPLTEDEVASISLKIIEGLVLCLQGFLARTSELVSRLVEPQTVAQFLACFREEIVEQTFRLIPLGDQHVHNRAHYFQIAAGLYGVSYLNDPQTDLYGHLVDARQAELQQQFRRQFHFLGVFQFLLNRLEGLLLRAGYVGRLTGEGESFTTGQFDAIRHGLQRFFEFETPEALPIEDWFLQDEETFCLFDVSWLKIIQTLIKKLLDEQFFKLNTADLERFKSVDLYPVVGGLAVPDDTVGNIFLFPEVEPVQLFIFIKALRRMMDFVPPASPQASALKGFANDIFSSFGVGGAPGEFNLLEKAISSARRFTVGKSRSQLCSVLEVLASFPTAVQAEYLGLHDSRSSIKKLLESEAPHRGQHSLETVDRTLLESLNSFSLEVQQVCLSLFMPRLPGKSSREVLWISIKPLVLYLGEAAKEEFSKYPLEQVFIDVALAFELASSSVLRSLSERSGVPLLARRGQHFSHAFLQNKKATKFLLSYFQRPDVMPKLIKSSLYWRDVRFFAGSGAFSRCFVQSFSMLSLEEKKERSYNPGLGDYFAEVLSDLSRGDQKQEFLEVFKLLSDIPPVWDHPLGAAAANDSRYLERFLKAMIDDLPDYSQEWKIAFKAVFLALDPIVQAECLAKNLTPPVALVYAKTHRPDLVSSIIRSWDPVFTETSRDRAMVSALDIHKKNILVNLLFEFSQDIEFQDLKIYEFLHQPQLQTFVLFCKLLNPENFEDPKQKEMVARVREDYLTNFFVRRDFLTLREMIECTVRLPQLHYSVQEIKPVLLRKIYLTETTVSEELLSKFYELSWQQRANYLFVLLHTIEPSLLGLSSEKILKIFRESSFERDMPHEPRDGELKFYIEYSNQEFLALMLKVSLKPKFQKLPVGLALGMLWTRLNVSKCSREGLSFLRRNRTVLLQQICTQFSAETQTALFKNSFLMGKRRQKQDLLFNVMQPENKNQWITHMFSQGELFSFRSTWTDLNQLFALLNPDNGFTHDADIHAAKRQILKLALVNILRLSDPLKALSFEDLLDQLEHVDLKQKNGVFRFFLKYKDLFTQVLTHLPDSPRKRSLLDKILSEVPNDSFLRQLMWAKRGTRQCSLDAGNLKVLADHQKALPPLVVPAEVVVPVPVPVQEAPEVLLPVAPALPIPEPEGFDGVEAMAGGAAAGVVEERFPEVRRAIDVLRPESRVDVPVIKASVSLFSRSLNGPLEEFLALLSTWRGRLSSEKTLFEDKKSGPFAELRRKFPQLYRVWKFLIEVNSSRSLMEIQVPKASDVVKLLEENIISPTIGAEILKIAMKHQRAFGVKGEDHKRSFAFFGFAEVDAESSRKFILTQKLIQNLNAYLTGRGGRLESMDVGVAAPAMV
jgi:hypothetical protein